MKSTALASAFLEEVQAAFTFLTADGFLGPEVGDAVVIYHSAMLSIDVGLDPREGVVTTARGIVGERHLRAGPSCLYVASGLGPAQHVKTVARTAHALRTSVASQSAALRMLLPRLLGTDRDTLLLECHGR